MVVIRICPMRITLVTLILFTFGLFAHAGTSIQDIEVFRLRNQFGKSDRKVAFQLYAGTREALVYKYNCTFRSSKLDDFSTATSQYAINNLGSSYTNEAPGFTKYIEVGVYHPDDHVGFKAAATPGEIQEVEIFRLGQSGTLYIERVLVSAPHSLSEEGQKRWSEYQRVYEAAVSFHDEKPGNERWQGLVTGYTACDARESEYNPYYTLGARFKKGSVEFFKGERGDARYISSGELAEPWTYNGVTYVGNITFLDRGRIHKANLLGEQVIDGIAFTGYVEFLVTSSAYHLSKATLARTTTINNRVYEGDIGFWAPSRDGRWVVSWGTLAQPAKVGRHVFLGTISHPIGWVGTGGERGVYEDIPSYGKFAEPLTIGGLVLDNLVGFRQITDKNLRIVDYSIAMTYLDKPATLPNGANIRAKTNVEFYGDPDNEFINVAELSDSLIQVTPQTKCQFKGKTWFFKSGRVSLSALASDCRLYSASQRQNITYKSGTVLRLNEAGEVTEPRLK